VTALLATPIEDVQSQLNENHGEFLRSAVLKAVVGATDLATTAPELEGWLGNTLFGLQFPEAVKAALAAALAQLTLEGFVRVAEDTGRVTPTDLGNATARSFIDLSEAGTIGAILVACAERVRLNTELQLLTILIPPIWSTRHEDRLVLCERNGELVPKRGDETVDPFLKEFEKFLGRGSEADLSVVKDRLTDYERYVGLRGLPDGQHSKWVKDRNSRARELYLAGCLQEVSIRPNENP
jgi:hypothetical protein